MITDMTKELKQSKAINTDSDPVHGIVDGYRKRRRRYILVVCSLLILTLALALFLLTYGHTVYSLTEVAAVLRGEAEGNIVFTIKTLRIPRILIGLLAGISFGIAGYTFQTLLKNDLASPDIIGISSGCSTAVVFSVMILNFSGLAVSVISLVAGLLAALAIFLLAQGKRFSKGRLILIGLGMQALLRAVTNYILIRGAQYDVSAALRWLSGSLNGAQMSMVPVLLIVTVIFSSCIVLLSRHLRVMQLGDEMAIALGLPLRRTTIALILCSVFLIAFASATTGPIASVSFLAGPIATRLNRRGKSSILPAAFVGAALVLGGDILGQFAFASRYPVGVVTGVLGAPYMLFLLIHENRKGENTT